MIIKKPSFKPVINTLKFLIITNHIAPQWLLHIFPRLTGPTDGEEEHAAWKDFQHEMERMRKLVNMVPDVGPNRQLEYVTNQMTASDRDEFRRLGNNLLVS